MNRLTIVLISLLFVISSCVTVVERDENSIEHAKEALQVYMEDVARAAGYEDPADLSEDDFPIGDLSFDEYQSALAQFQAAIRYEQAKGDPANMDTE